MCGIAGEFHFAARGGGVDPNRLSRMARNLAHRGPDDDGIHCDGSLGLAFRRLAILDLSPAGHQPMTDAQKRVWLVFNGEIYNFREVRQELEALGHVFRSQTDTEVILKGYLQWGDAVLEKLNGMFGLAIWDSAKRRLLVARDAMGIKPVYFSTEQGRLVFGSEIRAVVAGLETPPAPDPVALSQFLRYRYTPAPLTAFRGIRKLAPGEKLVVEQGGDIQVSRWYEFRPTLFASQPSDEEAVERLLDIYEKAVERHLISDVPVGLLLSGGMDSGLLLGLMKLYGADWQTYTVGYGSSFRDDELQDAAETARHYGARNTAVRIDRAAFEEALPRIVGAVEEPIASSSVVPMYFVCQRARQDVTVALIGQGPDELFGGYTRHLGVAYGKAWRNLPAAVRLPLTSLADTVPRLEALKRGAYALGEQDRMRRYQQVFSLVPGGSIQRLFQPDLLGNGAADAVPESWENQRAAIEGLDELGGFQHLELRSSLADELLMYGDKLSMAHSLEARVPFLDREIVEYAQRLGPRFKVRAGQRKWLHRQVCHRFLPQSIVNRKKRGFAVNVVDDWFKDAMEGQISETFRDHQSLLYGFLDQREVLRLQDEHRRGARDNHKLLFSLIVLEQWLRQPR